MRNRITTDSLSSNTKVAARSSNNERELDGAPPYEKENVSHIVNMLSQVTSSLETAKKAAEILTSVPSDSISPDGMLGGRGYVMPIRGMKTELSEAVTTLSTIRDTLADELNNPGWGLSKDEKDSVTKIQQETESKAQDEIEDIAKEIKDIFGEDPESDVTDSTGEEDTEEDTEEGFPSFEEEEEEGKEETTKFASSSNIGFVGLSDRADKVSRKIASSVLLGLVNSCTKKGTK